MKLYICLWLELWDFFFLLSTRVFTCFSSKFEWTLNLCLTIKRKSLPTIAAYNEVIPILWKAGKSQLWALSLSVFQVWLSTYLHYPCTLHFSIITKVFPPSLFGYSVQNIQNTPNSFSLALLFPQFQKRITSICPIFCSPHGSQANFPSSPPPSFPHCGSVWERR